MYAEQVQYQQHFPKHFIKLGQFRKERNYARRKELNRTCLSSSDAPNPQFFPQLELHGPSSFDFPTTTLSHEAAPKASS